MSYQASGASRLPRCSGKYGFPLVCSTWVSTLESACFLRVCQLCFFLKLWFARCAGGAHCQLASFNMPNDIFRARQRVRLERLGKLLFHLFVSLLDIFPCSFWPLVHAGVMRIRNNKGKYPMDVCNNNKTRAILRQTFAHLTFVPTTVKSDESSASGRSKADKLRHTVKTAKRWVSLQLPSLKIISLWL